MCSSGAIDEGDDKEVSVKTKSPAKNLLKQRDVGYRGTCIEGALHILSENARNPEAKGVETWEPLGITTRRRRLRDQGTRPPPWRDPAWGRGQHRGSAAEVAPLCSVVRGVDRSKA